MADETPRPARQGSVRYIDRPELAEVFADAIHALSFDGQSLRIEFGVTRLDETVQGAPPSGRRYPACRLVLTPGAAVELINRMQQVAAALTRAGVLKVAPGPDAPAAATSGASKPTAT